MTQHFNIEQRSEVKLRTLITIGNCLSLWAGRAPKTPAEQDELDNLFNEWESCIERMRVKTQGPQQKTGVYFRNKRQ